MAGHPVFAAIYDRLLDDSERKGLGEMRGSLLAGARGRVLELGSGTGVNLAHYSPAVTDLVLTEPDPHMAKRLRSRLREEQPSLSAEVLEIGAESLPFEDASFDTVVSTLVFCTIPDPAAAAAEAHRVLKPGGQLLFIEHVRGEEGSRLARWQDRLERPWGWFSGGCHPNRDTGRLLGESFDSVELETTEFPGSVPPLAKPMIAGTAVR